MKFHPFYLILIFLLLSGCKGNVEDIKTPVFGNLELGSKINDYYKKVDSLRSNHSIYFNDKNSAYFVIEEKGILTLDRLVIFPFIFYNSDSIITKICYYPYDFELMGLPENNTLTEKQKESITSGNLKELSLYEKILKSFYVETSSIGADFYAPNLSSNAFFPYQGAFRKIEKIINAKYGSPSDTVKNGNVYDNSSFGAEEYIWRLDKMNIRLITKKFPENDNGVYKFYNVLIYEFNEKTRKKYNLNSTNNDLNKTF